MSDELLDVIARYVTAPPAFSDEAYRTARYCLADALGCAILSLKYPACKKLLGSVVPGMHITNGCRIPGTGDELDPVSGAFNLGAMIRWLDFNDTWLAAEWGHPSDNIGGLLALADYISRRKTSEGKKPLTVEKLLTAIIKAYEIQGGLAMLNSFNRIGFDHVIFVKAATAAVATHLLGGSHEEIAEALSQAWIDTGPLRTYRHAPNVGSRKSWAAGDATSRGVWLSLMTMRGEKGYNTPLSAPKWGLYDVLFEGRPFSLQMPLGCYVTENILFKVAFPAEFHAQTAVEAAITLHPKVAGRWDEIKSIKVLTQEPSVRIIDKKGTLKNPADRDHCLQYMIAIGLLKGQLTADDYEDEAAKNPLIDRLREKMVVYEHLAYTRDYLDPNKRSIANAIKIYFKDGSETEKVVVEYPLGHRRRRKDGVPLLIEKMRSNLKTLYPNKKVEELIAKFENIEQLKALPVSTLVDGFLPNSVVK